MLASFDGLAVRQLRTRRLRSALTTFGIVLGVGMVFGVLTLTGTIRSTFDHVISSAWGSKDLIVTPAGGGGLLRDSTVEQARAVPGVKDASGMVELYTSWIDKYPIVSIEDGLSEDDWDGWKLLTEAIGNPTPIEIPLVPEKLLPPPPKVPAGPAVNPGKTPPPLPEKLVPPAKSSTAPKSSPSAITFAPAGGHDAQSWA